MGGDRCLQLGVYNRKHGRRENALIASDYYRLGASLNSLDLYLI